MAPKASRESAETIAVQALGYLVADSDQLARFLALSGLEGHDIRAAAAAPGFLAGVLDHVVSDESLLVAFAADAGLSPADVAQAHAALAGVWERDSP